MVSPLLVAGAVDHTLYDHTSVIRTVMQRFEVSGDLGRRVASANALAPPFAEQPRADVPDLPAPAAMNDQVAGDLPHTQIQASLVRAAVLRLSELGAPLPDETKLNTRLSSEAELQRVAAAVKPG